MSKPYAMNLSETTEPGNALGRFKRLPRTDELLFVAVAGVSADAAIVTAEELIKGAKDLIDMIIENPEDSAPLSFAASFMIEAACALHESIGIHA